MREGRRSASEIFRKGYRGNGQGHQAEFRQFFSFFSFSFFLDTNTTQDRPSPELCGRDLNADSSGSGSSQCWLMPNRHAFQLCVGYFREYPRAECRTSRYRAMSCPCIGIYRGDINKMPYNTEGKVCVFDVNNRLINERVQVQKEKGSERERERERE